MSASQNTSVTDLLDGSNLKESTDVKETTSFDEMGLHENLLRGIYAYGFQKPSHIQSKAIVPMVQGRDVLAQAQSGTGKTGTFVIGSLSHVDMKNKHPQVLVMVHVHELAEQIADVAIELGKKMKLNVLCAVGGNPLKDDTAALEKGVQFVVGTPGRVLDLISRGILILDHIKYLILDEADEMLEELFYKQVLQILQKGFPPTTHVALLSATMPPNVLEVANRILQNPVRVLIPPSKVRVEAIQQYYVDLERDDYKFDCICDLYKRLNITQAVIFCNKKQTAEKLAERMTAQGMPIACIHGDLEKPERKKRMEEFRSGKRRALIATDILARGIDVQQMSLVINFELPPRQPNYMHRIGRAGRYGRCGTTINLITSNDYPSLENLCSYYDMKIDPLPNDLSNLKV